MNNELLADLLEAIETVLEDWIELQTKSAFDDRFASIRRASLARLEDRFDRFIAEVPFETESVASDSETR